MGEAAVVDAFLAERGVSVNGALRQAARGLYERVLACQDHDMEAESDHREEQP